MGYNFTAEYYLLYKHKQMEKTIFALAEEKINAFEKSITEFKKRIATGKKENISKYEKSLAEIEQKASDIKKRVHEYKEEGKDKWDAYYHKFNHDLDELGKALKNFKV